MARLATSSGLPAGPTTGPPRQMTAPVAMSMLTTASSAIVSRTFMPGPRLWSVGCSLSDSTARARDLRLLTVPTATPSAVAVSRLVSARCSAARPPRAARRSPRRALARRRRQGDACRVVRSRDIGQRTRRPLSPPVPPLAVAERVDQGPVDVRVTVVCPAYLRPADVASRERGLDDIRGVVTRAAQPDGRTHQRPPARTDTG